jgi:hypothetical protein
MSPEPAQKTLAPYLSLGGLGLVLALLFASRGLGQLGAGGSLPVAGMDALGLAGSLVPAAGLWHARSGAPLKAHPAWLFGTLLLLVNLVPLALLLKK